MFRADGRVVFIDPTADLTTVEESADQQTWTTVAATAYVPVRRAGDAIRWLELHSGVWATWVRVTAPDWGEDTAVNIRQACLTLAVRYFKRPDSPEGIVSGEFGAARLARMDPDVLGLVRPMRRLAVG